VCTVQATGGHTGENGAIYSVQRSCRILSETEKPEYRVPSPGRGYKHLLLAEAGHLVLEEAWNQAPGPLPESGHPVLPEAVHLVLTEAGHLVLAEAWYQATGPARVWAPSSARGWAFGPARV
jgi:hypothetical protein